MDTRTTITMSILTRTLALLLLCSAINACNKKQEPPTGAAASVKAAPTPVAAAPTTVAAVLTPVTDAPTPVAAAPTPVTAAPTPVAAASGQMCSKNCENGVCKEECKDAPDPSMVCSNNCENGVCKEECKPRNPRLRREEKEEETCSKVCEDGYSCGYTCSLYTDKCAEVCLNNETDEPAAGDEKDKGEEGVEGKEGEEGVVEEEKALSCDNNCTNGKCKSNCRGSGKVCSRDCNNGVCYRVCILCKKGKCTRNRKRVSN